MPVNPYFSQGRKSEQLLYEDIIIESMKIYGQNVYYLPREIVNEDKILGHDIPSTFTKAYSIEMYLENTEGYDGEGDLFSKFGVEIRDQATFIVSRKRWKQTVSSINNEINSERPREGDLVWIPMTGSMFQIMKVEHEVPFYALKNLPTYKLQCELFEYNDEQLDTGQAAIDAIETTGQEFVFTLADSDGIFVVGENLTQVLSNGVTVDGEISYFNDSDDVVKIVHMGSDDDAYHTFGPGVVSGSASGASRTIIDVSEELNQANAQNEEFKVAELTFLDFAENNPFGEPD